MAFDPASSRTIRAQAALQLAQRQVARLVENNPDYFPLFTEQGRWQHGKAAWTNWCEGFLPGQMWIFAKCTGDEYWRNLAEHYSRLIEHRQHDRNVHDLGFLFWSSWKRWYDFVGNDEQRQAVITAGQTMGHRFNEQGRYLRSFVAPESTFIDIMMNVGIIFYAAQQTGDTELLRMANEHCLTTRRFLVRGDGSTAHEGLFDLETGEFLRQSTHQGWRSDSSWARGQAWALYGFTTAFRMTGDHRYLDTAERCATFFIERTGDRFVPPNDWDEPSPVRPWESSAAAIAASGLLQLSRLEPDEERQRLFGEYGGVILDRLLTPDFLPFHRPDWEGLLLHGSYHERNQLGVDESVMWGDYFLVEALDLLFDMQAS